MPIIAAATTRIIARTSDATARNSGNTGSGLTDDDTLLFAMGANEIWHVEAWLLVSAGNATMDAKYGCTLPAGASFLFGALGTTNLAVPSWVTTSTGSAPIALSASNGGVTAATVAGTLGHVVVFMVTNGATAGNFTLKWAQATADAADLILLTGSHLRATRVK